MAERYLRQSPLAHLGLERRARDPRGKAGVAMAERPFPAILNLRVRGSAPDLWQAIETALGFALPREPNRATGKDGVVALWLGPDEWWLIGPLAAQELNTALSELGCTLTEVGDSRTCIRISGPRARALIAKGCPLDLHPRVFGPGQCAQSLVAKAGIVLHQVSDEPAYDLYVLRSFAEYLWLWLEDAAREYRLAVVDGAP